MPIGGGGRQTNFIIDGQPATSADNNNPNNQLSSATNVVGLKYFETMGIALLQGRDFTAQDADGAPGVMGFISSVTEPFCSSCNRIRLTADGKLRTCLFSLREHDLLSPLRAGASDDELAALLLAGVQTKELKHHITDGMFVKPGRTMSQIGG